MPRTALLTQVFLLASCAALAARTLPQFPPPDFLDAEVSTNCPITNIGTDTAHFDFSLSFQATPSNNVEVAFGTDADANGVLDIGEETLSIGWDCSHWFVDHPSVATRIEEPANAGAKTLSFALLRTPGGVTRSLSVLDGTNAVLGAFTEAPPSWAFDPNWNLLRLTARGVDTPDEHFTVRFAPDRLLIRLR